MPKQKGFQHLLARGRRYQELLASGQYASMSQLARAEGITHARVGHLLDLLALSPAILAVLDGSKALAKAVRQVFGEKAEIQRCHVHKERNVLDHLPANHQRTVRMRLRAAWNMKDHEEARSELLRLTRYLKDLNPSAAKRRAIAAPM